MQRGFCFYEEENGVVFYDGYKVYEINWDGELNMYMF